MSVWSDSCLLSAKPLTVSDYVYMGCNNPTVDLNLNKTMFRLRCLHELLIYTTCASTCLLCTALPSSLTPVNYESLSQNSVKNPTGQHSVIMCIHVYNNAGILHVLIWLLFTPTIISVR